MLIPQNLDTFFRRAIGTPAESHPPAPTVTGNQKNMSTEENKKRTITLTDRPPVSINQDDWPVRAQADWSWHEGEHECQAFRKKSEWLRVRQHTDGRTLVYCGCSYSTAWQNEESTSYRGGVMLTPTFDEYPESLRVPGNDWTGAAVIDAIREVGLRMAKVGGCDQSATLIDECIADLPAVTLD